MFAPPPDKFVAFATITVAPVVTIGNVVVVGGIVVVVGANVVVGASVVAGSVVAAIVAVVVAASGATVVTVVVAATGGNVPPSDFDPLLLEHAPRQAPASRHAEMTHAVAGRDTDVGIGGFRDITERLPPP
jgi:hypothetical protein